MKNSLQLSTLVLTLIVAASFAHAHDTSASTPVVNSPPVTMIPPTPPAVDEWRAISSDERQALTDAFVAARFYDCVSNGAYLGVRPGSDTQINTSYVRNRAVYTQRVVGGGPLFRSTVDSGDYQTEIDLDPSHSRVTRIALKKITWKQVNFGNVTSPDYRTVFTEELLQNCHAR